jgi:hypothetical protein
MMRAMVFGLMLLALLPAGPLANAWGAASPARIVYAQPETLALPGGAQKSVRSVLNITVPMTFGSYVWNEAGVAAGPLWVRVDPRRQILSVFRGGDEIGTAVILYGAAAKPTPAGRFPILEKRADYYSHTYDAPMPFMLRLTADGVAIHGSHVRAGYATHGCIGVPLDFARRLFAVARKGDEVFVLKS